jgi:ankyrin repeat protein
VSGVKLQGAQPRTFGGGQPNVSSSFTPLQAAALNNDVPLIQSLLKHRAKIDLKDSLGRTALLLAPVTEPGGVENASAPAGAAFKVLLANGADPNIADASGNTALLLAVSAGQKDAVEQLIEKGANLNGKSEDGRSPLLVAIKAERSDLAELLLSKGADPNQKGPSGYAPLHVAAGMHGSPEMARLLIGYKADVNARDDAGNTPLHYAAVHGAKASVKLLLENGADRSAANGEGETPLSMLTGRKGVATPPWSWNDWGLPARLGWGPEQAGRIRTIPSSHLRSGQLPLAETVQQTAELLQEPAVTSQPAADPAIKK